MTTALTINQAAISLDPETVEMADNAVALATAMQSIADEGQALEARQLLVEVHTLLRTVDKARTDMKAPALLVGKLIDSTFKPTITKLENSKATIAAHLTGYASAAATALAALEAAAEHRAEVDGASIPAITPAVVAAHAAASVIKTREFSELIVDDQALIPAQFMVPDLTRIRAAWAAGNPVPGTHLELSRRVTA